MEDSLSSFNDSFSPNERHTVAIAASAGGLEPLQKLVSLLPSDFPAPVLVVQHLSPIYPSELDRVMERNSALRVKFAEEGESFAAGTIYLAPPDKHLLMTEDGTVALSTSAKICFTRPAADLLMLSMALHCREQAIAVVLSGRGHDGSMGVRAIRGAGGTTIVQDPATCTHSGMPESAMATGCVDLVLSPHKIASALIAMVMVKGAGAWLQAPALIR